MRTALLTVHVAAIAAWLGGNFAQLMLLPMFERSGHAGAALWHHASGRMAKVYYSVAGVMIALTGIGLVQDGPYSFQDGFVSIGLTVVVIGGILGVVFFGPQARAAKAAHDARDATAAAAARRRIVMGALLDTALVLFAVWAMVKKIGV